MRATTHFTIELATTPERSENGYRPFHTFTSQGTLV